MNAMAYAHGHKMVFQPSIKDYNQRFNRREMPTPWYAEGETQHLQLGLQVDGYGARRGGGAVPAVWG